MSRIFLDVGANTGQTLAAVMDYQPRFGKIVCFEPASPCWLKLHSAAQWLKLHSAAQWNDFQIDVCIENFGLWNQTCDMPLIEPGRKGASIWKKEKSTRDNKEMCHFVRATDWFVANRLMANLIPGDTVFLKLNCEGAECDILDDLLDSGEFAKVSYAMIDFDVRKIASQKHREAELRARLEREGIGFPRVAFSRDVMKGETHAARIQNWLRLVESK